jgi:hypothetical protein
MGQRALCCPNGQRGFDVGGHVGILYVLKEEWKLDSTQTLSADANALKYEE